jgi:BirA family biotin operon repressor/biotin-[acetyl-CoA-carboxylase] ligase
LDLKEQVLETLENNKGQYVSGNELAEKHYVSRNAVWKAVKALQEEGHRISAVTNKGYCLDTDSDIFSAQSICKYLHDTDYPFRLEVHKTVTSTNTVLKQLAARGEAEGLVVVAEEQTAGKGRLGRSFFSPNGTGVYFSLLLRPKVNAGDATLITTAAAVSVAKAIETVTESKAEIKWVNDVFCGGKKVCGILTEGSFDMESGGLEYAVLGIGINVSRPVNDFPQEISNVATGISDGEASAELRSRLIAETLKCFWAYYKNLPDKSFLQEYKKRSFVLGRDILVLSGNTTKKARAIDLDDECRLIVRYEDGLTETLSSGEVSIRPETTWNK